MNSVVSNASSYRKQLIWNMFDTDEDENFKVDEIRVCDCFLEWAIYFLEKCSDNLFAEKFMNDFLNEMPTIHLIFNVHIFYGRVTVVSCSKALYHFFYKDDINQEKMDSDCLADEIDMRCMYFLERSLFFDYICSNCQLNFIKTVSEKRFTIIKKHD